jgi:hypothetical protein
LRVAKATQRSYISYTIGKLGKLALVISCSFGFLGLVACGDMTTGGYMLPTVTPLQSSGSTSAVGLTSPTPQSSIDLPTTPPSSTNSLVTPAAGTTIQVDGTIQQIIKDKGNIQIILADNHFYLLKPDLVKGLDDKLRTGVPITFVGQYDQAGLVRIIKVSQLDHQAISDAPANDKGGNPKDQGKDNNKNKDGKGDDQDN